MNTQTKTALCAILALMATTDAGAQFTAAEIPVSGGYTPNFGSLDSQIRSKMEEHQVSSVTVGIMETGTDRVVYERGFGWRDYHAGDMTPIAADNPMRIASVTKPMIASAIHELRDAGLLTYTDRVFQYGQPPGVGILPAATYSPGDGPMVDLRLLDITVVSLLLHRGGFDRSQTTDPLFNGIHIANQMNLPSAPGPINTIRYMMSQPLDYTPGTASGLCGGDYCYSNFGFMLLAQIIREITGQDPVDYIHGMMLDDWGGAPHEVQHGRTFRADQDPREPKYETWWNAPNVFNPTENVLMSYGGWEQEVLVGGGDLVANTTQLLWFAEKRVLFTQYPDFGIRGIIGEKQSHVPSYDGGSGHTGALWGTRSNLISKPEARVAILCNQWRKSNGAVSTFADEVETLVYAYLNVSVNPNTYATENWVDFSYPSSQNYGTFDRPMNTLPSVFPIVQEGGTVKVMPGSTPWTGTLSAPTRIVAPLGDVKVGS